MKKEKHKSKKKIKKKLILFSFIYFFPHVEKIIFKGLENGTVYQKNSFF